MIGFVLSIISLNSADLQQYTNHIVKLRSSMKDDSSRKKDAFKSFLETNASPLQVDTKKNTSDHEEVYQEQYMERSNNCSTCGEQVTEAIAKKKICGFCEQAACLDHLRKRRRKKNKWEKICDCCQDKFLYDSYMKLQIKAQQSLSVEEQIVAMKHSDMLQVLENKKVKRRELSFSCDEIQSKYDEKMMSLIKEDNRFLSISNRLESDEITCNQIQQYIHRMQNKIKCNYEQDFKILSQENEKVGQELTRIEKRCWEVRTAIQKREKELEQAYQRWQRKQYGNIEKNEGYTEQNPKQQKCSIF